MVITPLLAAIIIGSFWTGVGTTAVLSDPDLLDRHRGDVVITAGTAGGDDAHLAACEAKYRSYDADTDMYLSFGGEWKRCLL
ncbi:MAG: hypothetical protein EOP22_00025 [Hyphomicrobiales bacterium]|nr:MAG: hypothetical protein EOP22_00025 [Hyphomicrobiales bacterium]